MQRGQVLTIKGKVEITDGEAERADKIMSIRAELDQDLKCKFLFYRETDFFARSLVTFVRAGRSWGGCRQFPSRSNKMLSKK